MPPVAPANDPPDDSEEARLNALDERLAKYHRLYAGSDVDDLYYRATRDIVVAGRRWRKLANERIRPTGHTMARWESLFLVAFSDHALTQGELARLLNVEGPTLVRMLDVLQKEGLIDRRQSEIDRRVTTNAITAKGRQAIDDIMGVTNSLRAEVLQGLDPEELAVALKVLGQIIERIDGLR
ncbi:MAG TPA: MarR family transcriptional regulator [Caulobacteraceae bacterium]|jgi:MarR family transcriptional regulator for hemolysin